MNICWSYKERMRFDWSTSCVRACACVCSFFTIDCNFLFIECLHARTIYWWSKKKPRSIRQWKGRGKNQCVRQCRSEIDWSLNSTCNATLRQSICLMLINLCEIFANSWCASINHYISLFIYFMIIFSIQPAVNT